MARNNTRNRIRNIWHQMKQRCYNQTADGCKYYGKRGICVCDAWLEDFDVFYEWALSHGYEDGLTIDRIALDGDYEPSNCKWSTMKEQINHRTNTIYIEHSGETHTISEWSDILGIPQYVIRNRINRGWSTDRILAKNVHRIDTIYIEYSGEAHTISEWSDILGIPQYIIRNRFNRGWTMDRILNEEVRNYVHKI